VSQLKSRGLAGHQTRSGVGQDGGDAVAVDIGEGQLCAGVGAFLSQDQPRAFWPRGEVIIPVASATHAPSRKLAVGLDRGVPALFGNDVDEALDPCIYGYRKENSTPRSTHAFANACVAPAEFERASSR